SVLEASAVAAEIGDAVLYDVKMIGGPDAAEASGKPAICMSYVPMTTPDPGYPLPFFPLMQMTFAEDRGAWINRATHLAGRLLRCFYLPHVQAWRRDRLNLKNGPWFPPIGSIAGRPAPRLHFLSRHIVSPADRLDPDVQTLGFLYLDEAGDWEPSEALAAFLEAGPPPIYIGFGSMTAADPARTRDIVLEGVRRAGVRALIGKGWGALDHSLRDDKVFVIDYAPHQKLFPLTSATVHHGGAGTTGASLRAGKPTFVGAFSFDQPWWGARLKDLGVGPGARWLRSLTAEGFADALRDLAGRAEYQRNADALAQKIAAENGVRDGVAAVTRLLAA
ncbi:MAG: glycosyltransferase, partial [Pseudomonadota bacterium]